MNILEHARVIAGSGGNFIIGKWVKQPKNGVETYYIDADIFDRVSDVITLMFEDKLKELLQTLNVHGDCVYWEEDWHDRVVAIIRTMFPTFPSHDVSNTLSALGY